MGERETGNANPHSNSFSEHLRPPPLFPFSPPCSVLIYTYRYDVRLSLRKGLQPLHKKSGVHRHDRWSAELTRHVITSNKKIQSFRLLATELCHDDSVRTVASRSHDIFVLAVPTATRSEQASKGPQEAAGEGGEGTGRGRCGPGLGVGKARNVNSGSLKGAMWPGKTHTHEPT